MEYQQLIVLFTVLAAMHFVHGRKRGRTNALHLTIDVDQAGYGANPLLRTNATETEALPIGYWTEEKNMNRKHKFAVFNINNGTITILKDGLYNIYTSLAFEKNNNNPFSQYMVSMDNKVIKLCRRAEIFELKVDGRWELISQCATNGIFYLYKNQNLCIKSGNAGWKIITNIDVSYWGVVRF